MYFEEDFDLRVGIRGKITVWGIVSRVAILVLYHFLGMQDQSSIWEDLGTEFSFNNQEEAQNLVSILDEARIDHFTAQLFFEAEYQQVEFLNEFKVQNEGFQVDNHKSKKRYKTYLKKPDGYLNYVLMELGREDLRSKIFMHVFEEEVSQIQVENNYKIFSDRNRLRIFIKEGSQLNMLCKNKLLSLKEQLNVLHAYDQGLIAKISNSQILKEQLQKQGITAWFKMYRGKEAGFFFSKTLLLGEIDKIVGEVAKYSLSLLNFRDKYLKRIENDSIFTILKESISEQVQILRQEYEIDVQFNTPRHTLVVHKKHQCFGREVEQCLIKMINGLVIFSVQSKEIRSFCNALRKEIDSLPFLQERMKQCRNEIFLAINVEQLAPKGVVNSKMLENFLKFFKIVVDSKLQLRVFFHHLEQKVKRKEINRVIAIAEENNLHLKNTELIDRDLTQGIWTLRDCSEAILLKRQRELIQFIKSLVLRDSGNHEEIESIIDSFFDERSKIDSMSSLNEEVSERSKFQERGRMVWFTSKYEPILKEMDEDNRPFLLSTRRRDLEKVFESNTRSKFKIWNLDLNSKIQWPKEVQEVPIFIKKGFDGIKFNQKYQPINPSSLKVGESGLVVYMSLGLNLDFLPILQLEKID